MYTCSKCKNKPATNGSFCDDCSNGIYAADTGIGLSGRHTDGQGRRRNHV